MSVYKGLRINGEYYRGKNTRVSAFLNHLTYPFGNYIPFKGPYVPTTYHSHLAQGGPSDVLIHVLLLYTYSADCQVWFYSGRGSGQVQTKTDESRRSEIWAEVSPGRSCDQLDSTTKTTSIDPLRRFRSGGDGDGDGQGDRSSDLDDFRLRCTVKSGSTLVGGPVKSRRRRTKEEIRGLDKRLVRLELVTAWIQQLRITSVDPLRRFRSR